MAHKVYLLDIEGTTTPIDFVTKTLFPFARREMASFVTKSLGDPVMTSDAELLSAEYEAETETPPEWPNRPDPAEMVPYLLWLMDRDRKSRGLKSIQGRIWEEGYASGRLLGEIYPDVRPAIERWKDAGATVAIFSSGSVLAQKLIFGHLEGGPLTPLLDGYFDTEVGSKREAESYREIARRLGFDGADILFLSDIPQEIDAASLAGLNARQVIRDPEAPCEAPAIRDFGALR